MIDHLAQRQTAGLGGDHAELNAKLDAIARHFGIGWLMADGCNPLQLLWKSRDALATNELLNFGDAVANFENVDLDWLRGKVSIIKTRDDGNRAGAIFELLGLNFFLSAGNTVVPSVDSNPGYDAVIQLPDEASLLVSIKNHGITSYESSFRDNAAEIDNQFQGWLTRHAQSGVELRILCEDRLGATEWDKLACDIHEIMNGQLDGTAKTHEVRGPWHIILRHIDPEFHPLSTKHISSVVFISAPAHANEQNKFLENLRSGCTNMVRHTNSQPDSACRVLLVRLGANASINNCAKWAHDYFNQFYSENIGLILLYQSTFVTSKDTSSLTHYLLPILGPQFENWARPLGKPARRLPNLSVLIGVIADEAPRKVVQTDAGQIPLDDAYAYQRGDIYKLYQMQGSDLSMQLSNPAPRIMIHAVIEDNAGSVVLKMITPRTGELTLLP